MTGIWLVDRFEHVAGHFSEGHARLEHFEIGRWKWLRMWTSESQEGLRGGKAPVSVMVGGVEAEKGREKEERGKTGFGIV